MVVERSNALVLSHRLVDARAQGRGFESRSSRKHLYKFFVSECRDKNAHAHKPRFSDGSDHEVDACYHSWEDCGNQQMDHLTESFVSPSLAGAP